MDKIEVTRPISKIESHRLATRTGATPVAWMYENAATGEIKIRGLLERIEPHRLEGWTETPLYTHPPATDVAALVEAAKALEIAVTFADPPKLFNDVLCHDARVPVEFIAHLRQALAPFTKGQNDELA